MSSVGPHSNSSSTPEQPLALDAGLYSDYSSTPEPDDLSPAVLIGSPQNYCNPLQLTPQIDPEKITFPSRENSASNKPLADIFESRDKALSPKYGYNCVKGVNGKRFKKTILNKVSRDAGKTPPRKVTFPDEKNSRQFGRNSCNNLLKSLFNSLPHRRDDDWGGGNGSKGLRV
ncbi:MAG: hypothetical protein S4CHLAM7_08540 [Chlamydiae bacterium]|nr:hypothetical protein [Chlamydiota bacterium]